MGDLFQEHKRFIVVLALGGLGFLVARLALGWIFEPSLLRHQSEIRRHATEIGRGLPASVDLSRLRADADRARVAFEAQRALVHRVPSEGCTLTPEISDPDLHYSRMANDVRRREMEACAVRSIDVDPRLGLPESIPTLRKDLEWFLRGLDVVRQVLDLVVRVDTTVLEGGIARIERIEITPPARVRGGAQEGVPPFVLRHPVSFVIVGHPRAVLGLTEELVRRPQPGRGLLVDEATIRSLDQPPGGAARARSGDPLDRGRVELKLVVSAVDVNPEAQPEKSGRSP
jgi:hypothetical protein